MSVMIQVRNVPDELHRTLKARAALSGMSLSEYLLRELRQVAERPSREEIGQRLASRSPVRLEESTVAALEAERAAR